MKFIQKCVLKYPVLWRYISSLVILFIVMPIIFINGLLGKSGRYIGFVWYMFIAIFALYEVFKNLKISKMSALYLSLLVAVVFILEPNEVKHLANAINENDKLVSWIQTQFGWNILIVSGFALIPLILEKNIRQTWKMALLQQGIIWIILITVSMAAKMAWIINSYKYEWLFYFLSIAIISDIGGYFGGKYFAQYILHNKKIAPSLSPKKTWGGFIIGYIVSGLFVGIIGYLMGIYEGLLYPTFMIILMSFILPIISPIGDLFFSGFKRYLQIKDFSQLIPGHGGIMDRLDSVSFVLCFITLIFFFQ